MTTNVWKDEKIKCPKCKVYMKKEEVEVPGPNMLIDFCVQCHSYWFDKGEINNYIHSRSVDRNLRKKDGYLGWGKPACPRCGGKISLKFLEDLEVDHCDDCGGLWLDYGELKRLQDKDFDSFKERRLKDVLSALKRIAKRNK
jgi:Zn-finger nucleic acid-binding protein